MVDEPGLTPDDLLESLRRLHADVDARAAAVASRAEGRLQCRRGCAACCIDDLTVWDLEAERIRRAHGDLLARGAPAPAGRCPFLDPEKSCRIYADRPYVCRTQGLPLRWLEEHALATPPGETVVYEMRDICLLNVTGTPLELLEPSGCWTIGPFEARLRALARVFSNGAPRRVRLRDLFAEQPAPLATAPSSAGSSG